MVEGRDHSRRGRTVSRMGLLALATTALTSPAFSQAPPPSTQARPAPPGTSAAELDPAARVARPAPRRGAGAFAPEPPGPCPLETSDVEVTLSSVSFRGATAVGEATLRGAYAEFLGKQQKVSVICAIRDRAARTIFERGVLARVEIPEQRISGGALVLDVIEAHVVNVRVRGDVGPVQEAVERYAEKLRGMKPFDMAKAQRYLLLASDIPGVRVRAALRPSTAAERGAVDIDLTVTREEPSVFANIANTGSRSAGRWGGLLRGEAAGYTAYGESTALTAFHTLDSNEQWLVQATESARFGSEGFTARGALTYGESRPGAELAPLGLKSRSVVANLEGAYPVLRTRTRNLNVAGGLDIIDQRTRDTTRLFVNSHDQLRVVYGRLDGDYRTELGDRPALFTGGLSVRKGLDVLGASDAGDPRLTRDGAKPDAWLVRGQGGLDIAFTDRLSGAVRAQAQYTDQKLLPYEQIALGGLTVGRGYDPAAVLGDKGVSAAFEVRYGPLALHPSVQAAPYAFFDTGYVANNKVLAGSGVDRNRSLSSVGAGLIFRVFNRANLEVTYAHPLDATRPGGSRRSDRVLIQLTTSLM